MNVEKPMFLSQADPYKGATPLAAKPEKKKKKAEVEEPEDKVSLSSTPTKYPFTSGNKVEALENGDKIMGKIETMITGAKDTVQLQMYRLGHSKIVDLLAETAKKGVKVQVLLDPSLGYDSKDAEQQKKIQDHLTASGVELLKYPTGKPSTRIDHVKLLIVDNKSVLMGGMNYDQHSPMNVDSDVFMQGPVVGQAQDFFQNDWKLSGGKGMPGLKTPKPMPDANADVRLLGTEPDRKDINTALQENIKNAKKSIFMEAFALADKDTIQNLKDAKGRGVDVKVLLDPNKPVFFVNKKSANELKEAGVDVRWLNVDIDKREKLHSKLAMFDDDKVMIGSANFTKQGLDVNHEIDADIKSKEVNNAFTKMFNEHWETRAVESPPNIPDFNERPEEKPTKEILGKDLYRYFSENYHPESNRIFAGKRRDMVMQAIDDYDKTSKPAPVVSLGKQGEEIPDELEMKTIGDLASLFGDMKDFKMKPTFEDGKTIYDQRVEIAQTEGRKVHENVPRYLSDMVGVIQDKEIAGFVQNAIDNCPKGFFMAPSSSGGRHHPADEVDPNKVDMSSTAPNDPYKGGGLVLHSRRVQAMAGKLCDHYGIKGREKDEILAAGALHDMMKSVDAGQMKEALENGTEIIFEGHTRPDHGHTASQWIKSMDKSPDKKMTENIARYCDDHMAVWNEPGPTPPSDMGSFIISMADYTASRNEFYLEV
jgi:cardiolipin synthase